MSEISNYEAQKKKLQGLCDEHNFTFRFFKDRYPITLVITPINDVATQMDMLGNVEETGYCSQDSSMCWYFENSELKTKVNGLQNSRNLRLRTRVLIIRPMNTLPGTASGISQKMLLCRKMQIMSSIFTRWVTSRLTFTRPAM